MDNINLISVSAAVVILLVLVILIAVSKAVSGKNKKLAFEFLEGLSDSILSSILDIIKGFDPDDYALLEEFELDIINTVYDKMWYYIQNELENGKELGSIAKCVYKYINKNMLISFVDKIIEEKGIYSIIENAYGSNAIGKMDKVVEEDKKLESEFSDEEKYVETADKSDLPPAEPVVPTQEELDALNPQKDGEEAYDVNDESMELVDDHKIITTKDKNGNDLYYEIQTDGKKKRVTKEYALKYL